MRPLPVLTAVALAVAAVLAPAAGAASAPRGLAFYTPPKTLKGKHGDLIRERPLTGKTGFPGASRSSLVLYRSTSITGKPIAVSGTIAVPKGRPPKGGWPVVSWAHGTSGAADVCAPSRKPAAYAIPEFGDWLKAGYAVAATDYEGLGTPGPHPYLIGTSEARGVIDIVTAARKLDPRIGRRWIIAGHSQGGHAALFAAAEGPRWAPKLKLLGVDAFAPASHIHDEVAAAQALTAPSGLSVIGGLLVGGILATNPSIKASDMLTPQAQALLPDLERRCNAGLGQADSWGGLAPADIIRAGYDRTALYRVIDANDPARLAIHVPVLVQQGQADALVFPAFTDALVKSLEANGAKVEYRTYPGADHGGVITAGRTDADGWLKQRLR